MPRRRGSKNFIEAIVDELLSIASPEESKTKNKGTSLRGKAKYIEALRRSRKVRKEDVIDWLNKKFKANLPKSATWNEIGEFIRKKVSISALERYCKSKGIRV